MSRDPVELRTLADGPEKDRILGLIARRIADERVHLGLPPTRPVDRGRLLCGCPRDPAIGPSRIDDQGGCVACSP